MRIFNVAIGTAATAMAFAIAAMGVVSAQSGGVQPPGIFHSFSPPQPRHSNPVRPSFGDAFQRGRDAFRDGDYEAARKFWQSASEDGDLFAQWRLANMFRLGQGVPVDHGQAFKFYAKVAAQYSDDGILTARTRITIDAMVRLAEYYRTGIEGTTIRKNTRRAFRMNQMAATHYGHPGAQFALGQMYCRGEGVSASTERCMRWYMLAARKGHAEAQISLGDLYQGEGGLDRDPVRALAWYEIALRNAPTGLRQQIEEKYGALRAALTEDERTKAEKQALSWQAGAQARAN